MGEILNSVFFENLKGKIASYVVGILLLISIWFLIPKIIYDVDFGNFSLDFILRILLSFFVVGYFIYDSAKVRKNNSKLPGLGIYISSSVLEKDDIRKNMLLSTLKNKISNEYEVIIYEKNEIARLLKKYSRDELMEVLNLSILFEVTERAGKKNNKDVYELKIVKSTLLIPRFIEVNCSEQFERDLTGSLNFCLEISSDNNISDVDNEISLFEIGLDYIQSILLSVSNNPEKAFKILDTLSGILKVTNIKKKSINYIKENLKYRYIDTYYSIILKILYEDKYYINKEILRNLKENLLEYKKHLDKNRQYLSAKQYNLLINNYYLQMAIVLYEERDIKGALDSIYKCNLATAYNYGAVFSKAFLLANDFQYLKAYYLYKRLSKKKMDSEYVNDIIGFIEKRYNLNENDEPVKFCLAMVNYYFKDDILAKQYFEELSYSNDEIKEIYNEMLS
ncbi:MAG: hypothetical protein IJN90_05900 [Bacilli bacterium]|nr:hypothetical protein [Bacilli bacterium]